MQTVVRWGRKTLNCAPASFLFFRSVKDNRYLGDTFRTNHGVGMMKMKAMVVQGENFARPNQKETWARAGARNFWGLWRVTLGIMVTKLLGYETCDIEHYGSFGVVWFLYLCDGHLISWYIKYLNWCRKINDHDRGMLRNLLPLCDLVRDLKFQILCLFLKSHHPPPYTYQLSCHTLW